MVMYDLVNHKICQLCWSFSVLHFTYLQYEENDTDLHVRHSAMCKWNATSTRICECLWRKPVLYALDTQRSLELW